MLRRCAIRIKIVSLLRKLTMSELWSVTQRTLAHVGQEGAVVLAGGGTLPKETWEMFCSTLPKDARIFVDTSATTDDDAVDEKVHEVVMRLNEYISTRQILTIARPLPPERLVCDIIDDVHAVWFPGGSIEAIATRYSEGLVKRALHRLVRRGGVVGGTSAGACCLGTRVWNQQRVPRYANFGMDSILFHNPSLPCTLNAATGTSKCVKCHRRAPS